MSSRFRENSRAHQIVAVALVVIAGVVLAMIRVKTSLGVKVRPTYTVAGDYYDKTGREYIWRIWWRARDELFDVHEQWVVTIGLLTLCAVFAAALLGAIWIAMSPDNAHSVIPE